MQGSLPLFWKRLLAFALDYIIISVYLGVLVLVSVVVARTPAGPGFRALFDDPNSAEATAFLLLVVPVLLYFAIFESSRWQATWGKRVLRLRAETTSGERAGFLRALWRNALKLLPWELTHACLWRIPGWPFDPQTPPLWINVGLILVWVIVVVYVVSLLLSRTGQTLYDHLAGMRIALAASIAEPHDRRIK
ncbi:MAG TPA: RDD family protein [Ktedonobacterales bacterium]|nr:RDD family protein [Ktedonobacterales bacterium]